MHTYAARTLTPGLWLYPHPVALPSPSSTRVPGDTQAGTCTINLLSSPRLPHTARLNNFQTMRLVSEILKPILPLPLRVQSVLWL